VNVNLHENPRERSVLDKHKTGRKRREIGSHTTVGKVQKKLNGIVYNDVRRQEE
jgi:hypothetical protein